MAISQEQKVDFLLKKIGYTKTKTGLAVDSSITGTKKAGFAEALPSPLIIGDTSLWTESGLIPTTPPGSDTSQVKVYLSGSSGQRLTVDSTVADNRAFIAYTTYNNTSSARLTNWIDTQFGDNYLIKVYKGDPNSGGTALSASGSGNNDGWFFDYSAGVLNFNDTNVPSGVTSSNIYIVGYRYIGNTGAPTPGDDFSFQDLTVTRNLSVTGLSTFTGVGTFISDLHVGGDLTVKGTTKFEGGTLTLGDADTDNIVFGGEVDSHIIPDDNDTWDLGSSAKEWRIIYVDDVNVSGVSTFAGAIDANGSLDVDGHSELDDLNVAGVSTFAGEVDINGGGKANTFKVEDLTSGRVTYSGAGGELQDSANLTFDGTDLTAASAKISDLTDNRVIIAGASGALEDDANLTFNGTTLSVGVSLDVDGHTELDDVNVTGLSTFAGNVKVTGNGIDVTGLSTFRSGLNVIGLLQTNDDVNFTGAAANVTWDKSENALHFNDNAEANFGNTSGSPDLSIYHNATDSFIKNSTNKLKVLSDKFRVNNNADNKSLIFADDGGAVKLYNDGNVKFETTSSGIDVTGIATAVKLSTGSDGVGITTNVISGPATLYIDPSVVGDNTGEVRIKGDLYVDGTQFSVDSSTINLADYRIGIGTTAPNDTALDGAGIGIGSVGFEKTFVWESSATSLKSSEHLDLASGKVYKINGTEVLNPTTLGGGVVNSSLTNLGTLTALEVNGHTEVDNINVAGFSTFVGVATFTNNNVYISNDLYVSGIQITGGGGGVLGQDIEVRHLKTSGISTFGGNIDANGSLDVDGHSELDDLNVAGVSTFAGNIDANGSLDVDGHSELDDLNVAGVSTFAGAIDANGSLDVDGHSELDDLNVAGVSTFAGAIDANGSLDVDGHTEIDDLNVAGVSTFAGAIDANGNLDVDGHSELDDLNVAGVSTFTGAIDANGNLDVDGETELDNLRVAGLSTFVGVGTFTSDLHVGGDLTVKGTTKFEGGTLTLGDADTDNIVFGGEVDSNIIPDDNDTWALGSASKEWKIIYVDDVNVTGVSTFAGLIDANGDLDVDGHTELDNVNVSGFSTFVGFSTFSGGVQVGGALTVAGTINSLTDITINGVSVGAGEDPVAMAIALG